MTHWHKLSTAQVTERRSPSPASGTSFSGTSFSPPKRMTFDERKYPFQNAPPRSAVSGQGNIRGFRMSGHNLSSNRSMQGMRPNTWQCFNTTPPGFASNPPYNVFLLLQPKAKCERGLHSHPNYCSAINESCFTCGRRGHFSRMCRLFSMSNSGQQNTTYRRGLRCRSTPNRSLLVQQPIQNNSFV